MKVITPAFARTIGQLRVTSPRDLNTLALATALLANPTLRRQFAQAHSLSVRTRTH